jgi:carbon-monoxide dehydrogenase medium subunit
VIAVFPSPFEYQAPASLDEALALLSQHGDRAKVLAGGHSLLPLMKLRLAAPELLIDIGRIPELAGIREADGGLVIGARTTYRMVQESPLVRERFLLVQEAAEVVGDQQVRNRGTIGGALAHADPASDMPAVMLALNAELTLVRQGGRRTLPMGEFLLDALTTALQPGELLTDIRLPALPARSGTAYVKYPHPASGYAVVGVAAVVTLDTQGRCSDVRVGITGASSKAYRSRGVEQALAGQAPTEQNIAAAAERAAEGVEMNSDLFASAEYRAHLARVFTRRALALAAQRAMG